jgi:hypothetical protein
MTSYWVTPPQARADLSVICRDGSTMRSERDHQVSSVYGFDDGDGICEPGAVLDGIEAAVHLS